MAKKGGDVGGPRTGNGRTGGKKPKTADLTVLKPSGMVHRHQPPGWGIGKLLPFRRKDGK